MTQQNSDRKFEFGAEKEAAALEGLATNLERISTLLGSGTDAEKLQAIASRFREAHDRKLRQI